MEEIVRRFSRPEDARNFLIALGRDEIYRLVFFPPLSGVLPLGGAMYLNQLAHTCVSCVTDYGTAVGRLTANGLRIVDYRLTNHLFRPTVASALLARY